MAVAYSTSGIVRCHSEFTAKLVSSQKHHLSATPPAAANSISSNCSSYTSTSINRSNSNPRIATAVRQEGHPTPSCITPHHHPPTARLSSRPAAAAPHPPSRFSEVAASSSPSSSSSFSSRNRSRTRGRCSGDVLTSPSPCPSPSPSPSPSPCLSRQQASTNEGDRLFRVECHSSSSRSFRHQIGVDSLPRGIERVVSRATWRSLRTCLSSSATDAAEVDGTATDSSTSPLSSSPSPPPSHDAELEEPIAFCDEGEEMDVRVRIPGEMMPVESTDVRVVAEPGSLYVGIAKPDTEAVWLLEAPCLYAEIRPGDTVWFLDDESIVINLRKINEQWKWPGLKQEWDTLSKGVAKLLKGSSVYVVGERTEVNACVANELAPALGYVPLNTQQLVEQVTKMPISELAEDEGTVAEAEKAVLVGLSTHVRCVVSTIGGNEGAAARTDGWNHLHCGVTVWVHCGAPDEDEETGRTIVTRAKMESSLPEPAPGTSYGKADVTVAVGSPQVRWEADATRPVAEGVLKAVKQLLERDSELPGKKGLYRRLGCRGDWPYIMPPGWNPNPSEEGKASESDLNELEQLVESLEGSSSTSQSGISGVHSEVTELLQASQEEKKKDAAQEQQQQQTTAIPS